MTCGPAHTDLPPTHANLGLTHEDLCPARANLGLVHTENQPELTSGALFHGYFHVLRWVQKVCPS